MATIYESETVRITTDTLSKALIIKLSGFAPKEKASSFIDLYNMAVGKVVPSRTTLIIDSSELKTFAPQILPVLEQSYKLYMSTGFKNVIMVNPKDITAKSQLKRIGNTVSFTGLFVDSQAEALNISKTN